MSTLQATDIFISREDSDFLGRGSYGNVHRCYHEKHGQIAIKLVKPHGSRDEIERMKNEIQNEADILMRTFKSKYVIDFLGTVRTGGCVGLLMEYAPMGDLATLIQSRSVSWLLRLRVAQETACGIAHLHNIYKDSRITHCDLKPNNILLGSSFNVKICDFQGARLALRTSKVADGERRADKFVYTANYASPEFFKDNPERHSRAMDVYSYAMVLFFILTGKHPFEKLEESSIIYKVGNGNKPYYNGEEIQKALSLTENRIFETVEKEMKGSWKKDPSERPAINTIEKSLRDVLETFSTDDIAAAVEKVKATIPVRGESVKDERITLQEKVSHIYPGAVEVNFDVKATCSTFKELTPTTGTQIKAYGRSKKTIDMSQEDFLLNVGDDICIITKNGTYTAYIKTKY